MGVLSPDDFCLILDPALDSDPTLRSSLLAPLLSGEADVVIGVGSDPPRAIEKFIGKAAGIRLNGNLARCQAFSNWLARSVPIDCRHGGAEAERIIQFSRRHARFAQVKVPDTSPATICRPCSFKAWLFGPRHSDPAADILVALSRAHRFNRWMADTLQPFLRGQILELGAGIGNLTVPLAASGNAYTATDTNADHLAELHARTAQNPNVKIALLDFSDASEIAAFRQSAETVVCLNSLEHIPDDQTALVNIYTCLRPGGTAVILVPQSPQLFGSLDEVLDHQRRYTKEELEKKMIVAGFRMERIIDFNRPTWLGWYLNSRILRKRSFSRMQLFFFDQLVPLWRRIDRWLPWPSISIIAIGKTD